MKGLTLYDTRSFMKKTQYKVTIFMQRIQEGCIKYFL